MRRDAIDFREIPGFLLILSQGGRSTLVPVARPKEDGGVRRCFTPQPCNIW